MNNDPHPSAPTNDPPMTSPAELAQAVATGMAEMAGNIGGTLVGAMAAPLTAASHAATIARGAGPDGDTDASPRGDVAPAAAASEPSVNDGPDGHAAGDAA